VGGRLGLRKRDWRKYLGQEHSFEIENAHLKILAKTCGS